MSGDNVDPPVDPPSPGSGPPGTGGGAVPVAPAVGQLREALIQAAVPPDDDQVQAVKAAAAAQNASYLRRQWFIQLVVLALVAAGGVWLFLHGTALAKDGSNLVTWHSEGTYTAAGAATTITAVVLLLLAYLKNTQGGLIAYVTGADQRMSTSQTQAAIWTIVVFWSFLYFGTRLLNTSLSQSDFTTVANSFDANYLLLLGGPFASAVAASVSTSAKTDAGVQQKTVASGPTVKDLTSDDSGNPHFADTQFLVFNLAAVFIFAALLAANPNSLPALPTTLVGLTSLSALTFIGVKVTTSNAPQILSIVQAAPVRTGAPTRSRTQVEIRGLNFTPPGATDPEYRAEVRVTFGTIDVAPLPGDVTNTVIKVDVPEHLPDGTTSVDVVVTTAAGVQTPKFALAVVVP